MFRQTHQPNPILFALAVLLLAALACGGPGSTDRAKSFVGLWQREDGKETIEFFEDGRVIINIVSLGITWTGTFKLIDDNNLQMDIEVLDEIVSSVYEVDKSADTLTLTSEDGVSATYARLK